MNNKIISNRYEFIFLYDVIDGNPNGDPDGGNTPRTDIETGHGLVTDVCLKRKVRNYIDLWAQEQEADIQNTHKLFIRQGSLLNDTLKENAIEVESHPEGKKLKGEEKEKANQASMCHHYYDVRTFGAVMSTGENSAKAGQVRGAIQMTFSRSIDPIFEHEHSITRMAKTNKKEADKAKEGEDGNVANQAMGTKYTVPYGLYCCYGFVTPAFAENTGFTEADLELFWEALENMFETDRSAARGLMSSRRLIIFKHPSKLGNAPAHKLFDLIKIENKTPEKPARSFEDYTITIDWDKFEENYKTKGIEIIEKL